MQEATTLLLRDDGLLVAVRTLFAALPTRAVHESWVLVTLAEERPLQALLMAVHAVTICA